MSALTADDIALAMFGDDPSRAVYLASPGAVAYLASGRAVPCERWSRASSWVNRTPVLASEARAIVAAAVASQEAAR